MAQMKQKISIPRSIKPSDRIKIANVLIDYMISRSMDGIDKNGKKFPKYTKAYADKKNVGVGDVDLTLSGDMLSGIELLNHASGSITIGFQKDDELNGRAEGNIKGSYGGEPDKKKARDFLGISDADLEVVIAAYEEDIPITGGEFNISDILDTVLKEELS